MSDRAHLVATYHYVRPTNSDGVTGLSPDQFRAQLRWIDRHYRIVTADEYHALAGKVRGLALITFDDGLKDQFTFAAPILADLGLPAVFFAPMRPVSDEPDGWCSQHLLHALAEHLGFAELESRVDAAMARANIIPTIDRANMDRLYHYEVPHKRRLKYLLAFALSAVESASLLREINRDIGLSHRDWFMSADELSQLQSAGHSLGGHGFDHVPYTTLDEAGQDRDMALAQHWMNHLFGVRPRPIAFPFGRADQTTYALLAKHGYTTAFTTDDRVDAKDVGRAQHDKEAA
jgi:peptidoglycan/xylan/chitin deacetylase (PgdA/CDA1 family)